MTGRSFFDGVPFVPGEIAGREQALARRLLESGRLDYGEGAPRPSVLPASLVGQARAGTGLDDPDLRSALADEADPNRCAVFIALVEAALDNPESVPTPDLAAL
ncbi:hypothetical protein K3172_01395 [Qipengyuania sp. 6B39]|uniref:hypothetical protein n=1 Tax=Qipengyuania proteolytica TaxID=2867239 RepID=UPI001C8A3D67|nr:hypothetical protein [Qipengyuania proteolytica]MBX7494506.1 hypothetical protein [Qipengyuania proteolytica]